MTKSIAGVDKSTTTERFVMEDKMCNWAGWAQKREFRKTANHEQVLHSDNASDWSVSGALDLEDPKPFALAGCVFETGSACYIVKSMYL